MLPITNTDNGQIQIGRQRWEQSMWIRRKGLSWPRAWGPRCSAFSPKKPAWLVASGHSGRNHGLSPPLHSAIEPWRAEDLHMGCVERGRKARKGAERKQLSLRPASFTPLNPASFLGVEKMVSSLSQSTGSKQPSGNVVEFKSKHRDTHICAYHSTCPFLKHDHSNLMATYTPCDSIPSRSIY